MVNKNKKGKKKESWDWRKIGLVGISIIAILLILGIFGFYIGWFGGEEPARQAVGKVIVNVVE